MKIRNLNSALLTLGYLSFSVAQSEAADLKFSCDFFGGTGDTHGTPAISCGATGLMAGQAPLDSVWTSGKNFRVKCSTTGDDADGVLLYPRPASISHSGLIFALFPKSATRTGPSNLILMGETSVSPKIEIDNINWSEIQADTRTATLEYYDQSENYLTGKKIYGHCQFRSETPSNTVTIRPM